MPVGACECAEASISYGRLRSVSNQFVHPHMQRCPAPGYLATVLRNPQA